MRRAVRRTDAFGLVFIAAMAVVGVEQCLSAPDDEDVPRPARTRRAMRPQSYRMHASPWTARASTGDAGISLDSPIDALCVPYVDGARRARDECGCARGAHDRELLMTRCMEWVDERFQGLADEFGTSTWATAIDPERLAACHAELGRELAVCREPAGIFSPSFDVFTDAARPGERCHFAGRQPCVGGWCRHAAAGTVCERWPELGETCDVGCAPGSRCTDGRCRGWEGSECMGPFECPLPLRCLAWTCQVPRDLDAPCSTDDGRTPCVAARRVPSFRCATDADCDEDDECVGARANICVRHPPQAGLRRCPYGRVDRGDEGCGPARRVGEECAGDCAPGLKCVGLHVNELYQCFPTQYGALGEPCGDHLPVVCGPGLTCGPYELDSDPVCVRALAEGDPCDHGLCDDDDHLQCEPIAIDGRCEPRLCHLD
jgi:hypothetical protein